MVDTRGATYTAGAGDAASLEGEAYRRAQGPAGPPARALPAARGQHDARDRQDEDGERRGHDALGVPRERGEGAPGGRGGDKLKRQEKKKKISYLFILFFVGLKVKLIDEQNFKYLSLSRLLLYCYY